MRARILSTVSHPVLHSRLPKFTAQQLANIFAAVYRGLGLTHLDHLTKR